MTGYLRKWAVFGVLVALFMAGSAGTNGHEVGDALSVASSQFERLRNSLNLGGQNAKTVRVVRIVDGDTIIVDDSKTPIRYIGVDTPETKKPGVGVQCQGPEAAAYNRRLVEGRAVQLFAGPETHDRYGRQLAYVEVRGRDVGAALLSRGLARAKSYPPNTQRDTRYRKLETRARRYRRGMWGGC